jgi:S-formylglutathione hydrolase FrmB
MQRHTFFRTSGYPLSICVFFLLTAAAVCSSPSIEIIAIPHAGLGESFNAQVVLPEAYMRTEKRFPVIYLLHGYGGSYASFSQAVNLKTYADSFNVILVCPDGNYNSWYLDSPVKKDSRFASYIVHDVLPYIDARFRTVASGEGRALIGSSMGGHGALTLLADFPDLFAGAGSISGILDLTAFPHEWDLARILGAYSSHRETWRRHSFLYRMENLAGKGKTVIIDCGAGDFALAVNRAAHEKMEKLGIDHIYYERPGGHSFTYVQNVLGSHLAILSARLHTP